MWFRYEAYSADNVYIFRGVIYADDVNKARENLNFQHKGIYDYKIEEI
jgi:hypothetical protein